MRTSGLLPHDTFMRVFEALQGCDLDIEAVLDAVPAPFRASVPKAAAPGQWLFRTLTFLNECATDDDPPPFVRFLKLVLLLIGPRPQAAVLTEAVSAMGEPTVEVVPENEQRQRATFVALVKRVYQHQGFEVDRAEQTTPVFVGWCGARARVVGVAVGDLRRVVWAVQEQMQVMRLVVTQLEGHVVFPEKEPADEEREVVFEAALSPVTLAELKRHQERAESRRASHAMNGLLSRQSAWAVEMCQTSGETGLFEKRRDGTVGRLAELVAELRGGRIQHALIRVSAAADLAIARSALLTAWYESLQAHPRPWPFLLTLEEPFPLDADEMLERVLIEQRITLDPSVARSLLWDEHSVPVLCCGAAVGVADLRRAVKSVLGIKRRGVLLVLDGAPGLSPSALLGTDAATARICRFPVDFESSSRVAA